MKSFCCHFFFLLVVSCAAAQTQPPAENYFPSPSEFMELRSVSSSETFSDPSGLSHIRSGKLISDVGFQKYSRRIYSLGESKTLSIEIIVLLDMQAAYSLLTLTGNSGLQAGPPGDEYAADAEGMQFSHGNKWIRIRGAGASKELVKRVASFVSEQIGPRRQKRPALISHLPKTGYVASTLKYFPGFSSFETFARNPPVWIAGCGREMEIARADYSAGNQTGRLLLLNFPTQELAEECYSKLNSSASSERRHEISTKISGPLVAIFEGSFDSGSAKKVLDSIQYNYSVNWIYEKDAKNPKKTKAKSVWGIPFSILDTVVKSIFFVVLLAVFSIGVGFAVAMIRFRLRSRMSKDALDDEFTHLRMR